MGDERADKFVAGESGGEIFSGVRFSKEASFASLSVEFDQGVFFGQEFDEFEGFFLVLAFLRNPFDPVAGPVNISTGKLGHGDDAKVDIGIDVFYSMGLPRGGKDHGDFFGSKGKDGVGKRIVPDSIGKGKDGVEAESVGGAGANRTGGIGAVLQEH